MANMTTVLQKIDPNNCNYRNIYTSWDNVFQNLGKTVVTSMYLGCEFSLNIYLSTSQNYTSEDTTNKYWQHIQNNTLQSLSQEFEGFQNVRKGGWTRGIQLLQDNQSVNSYLKGIGFQITLIQLHYNSLTFKQI